jgi:hypothetical protein
VSDALSSKSGLSGKKKKKKKKRVLRSRSVQDGDQESQIDSTLGGRLEEVKEDINEDDQDEPTEEQAAKGIR